MIATPSQFPIVRIAALSPDAVVGMYFLNLETGTAGQVRARFDRELYLCDLYCVNGAEGTLLSLAWLGDCRFFASEDELDAPDAFARGAQMVGE